MGFKVLFLFQFCFLIANSQPNANKASYIKVGKFECDDIFLSLNNELDGIAVDDSILISLMDTFIVEKVKAENPSYYEIYLKGKEGKFKIVSLKNRKRNRYEVKLKVGSRCYIKIVSVFYIGGTYTPVYNILDWNGIKSEPYYGLNLFNSSDLNGVFIKKHLIISN